MLKIISAACFIFLSNTTVLAEEINLECNVTSKHRFLSKTAETDQGVALIKITWGKGELNITRIKITSSVDAVNDLSVADGEMFPTKMVVRNLSSDNKWDIENIRSGISDKDEPYRFSTRIIIDRNAGSLIAAYTQDAIQRIYTTNVSGKCEKIDSSVKKF